MALTKSLPTGDAAGLSITDWRRVLAGMIAKNADGTLRAGLFGAPSVIVTGQNNMTYQVAPFWAATSRIAGGIELVANDAMLTVQTDNAPQANSRIDVIWVMSRFAQHADGSNLPIIGVSKGQPNPIPSKPGIPTGALEIATAEILSTTTQTSTAVIRQTAPYTAAAGGAVPLRSQAEQDAFVAADGTVGFRVDTGVSIVRFAGAWKSVSRGSNLIAAGSFSGVPSVSVDGVFSSAFDDYTIEIDLDVISAKQAAFLRLRSGGSTDTSGSYYYELNWGDGSTAKAAGANAASSWQLLTLSCDQAKVSIEVANPASPRRTIGLMQSMSWDTAVGPAMQVTQAGFAHGTTGLFDGFLLYAGGTSNITGRYRIYGHFAG